MNENPLTPRKNTGPAGSAGTQEAEPVLSREAQDVIARRLREAYVKALEEPVPDRLTELLAQLGRNKVQ